MDIKIIFVKTAKGGDEFKNKTCFLSGDYKRVLGLIDNKSSVEELIKRAAPSLRPSFNDMLQKLADDGFVQEKEKGKEIHVVKVSASKAKQSGLMLKMSIPVAKSAGEDLDFTSLSPVPAPVPDSEPDAAKEAVSKAAIAEQDVVVQRVNFEEVETARLKAEQEAAKAKADLAATQTKIKQEAEAKARAEAETARLKAEQEAAKAKAEQEAAKAKADLAATQTKIKQATEEKARAEAETARLKAEQEAAKANADLAEMQAKLKLDAVAKASAEMATQAAHLASPTARAPLPEDEVAKVSADEETRQLAESQSRIWADAEQRAKMQALQVNENQQFAKKVEKLIPAAVTPRARIKPRQPLPLGKIIVSLTGLFVALSLLLPFVWPMQEYINKFEQSLATKLQAPVHIGHMRASLLPLPKLELRAISVGGSEELQAATMVLNFSVLDLFSDIKVINIVEIDELTLKANSFDRALSWIQAAGGNENYPVKQMAVRRAHINGTDLTLPTVSGEVYFDGPRSVSKAVMSSEDRKLSILLQPQQSRWQLAVNIKENSLPLVPGIMFDELNLKGEVSASEARFNVIEGKFYKGKLLGSGQLSWINGWQMSGQINVTALSLQAAIPQSGLTGDLDGKASFTERGASLAMLAQTPHLNGNISVKKGFINGIDMVETVRLARRQGTSAGRTNFDELSGTLLIDGNNVQVHQIKILAGILSGSGFVDMSSGKQLSGRINVELKIRADMGSTPLTLSGTLAEPTWKIGR